MTQYGFKKSTDFTKKQINVIFAKAKAGALKVEKWFMSELYILADFFGYDDNRSMEMSEREVLSILDAVFANDAALAQRLIDETATKWYDAYSFKNQAKCDRTLYV